MGSHDPIPTDLKASRALLLSPLLLAACTITQEVQPITSVVTEVCVQDNPHVHMHGFGEEVRAQIAAKGIATRTFAGDPPADCRWVVGYTANWRWDYAMFLHYAEVDVYDRGELIGRAVYDARGGGANIVEKHGHTANKIRPLIDQLFPAR